MKKLFTFLVLLFGVLSTLMAEKVEVNGIYYYLHDSTNTATVTYKGDTYSAYDEYSGDIVIPSSITYNNVTYYVDLIGEEAFHYCKDLKTVTIPYSVTKISQRAFLSCKSLTSVTIANGLESIGDEAFRYCSALTKISLPNTLKGIGNYVFADCTALEKVSIPMNPNIGNMGFLNGVFSNCQSLKEIELPITNSICQSMFANCINLEKVSLPNTIVIIGDYAFYSCSALKEIIIPESVKKIGKSAFEGSSITSIVIPNLVTTIGEKAFSNCPLTSINIGSGITTIDAGAFANNTQNYSPKVNYEGTLDSWAGIQFKAATSNPTYYGKDLYIKDELVTEVEISSTNSIKNYAFINCASIKSLKISSNVGSIGERVFEGCSSLSSITSYATAVPATYNNTFAQQYYSANLKVLCDVVDAYKAHSIFGNFINIECFTEEGGDDNGNDNTGGDNTGGDDEGGEEGGSEGGDQGGDDTGDVEIGEPANLYIIGALTGWAADATWQFSTADDEYFVLSFPQGQEQELSGQFKVASSNWSPYNYGAPLDLGSVEAGKEYVLEYNVSTNLSIANIIKVSKIEFTLSTQTLKITGATEEKVFDTTFDYGFYLYADYKDYPFTFKGNGVYEYDYTSEGPSSTIGDYQYKTVEWGRNSTGNQVTLGELYQLGLSNHPISFPDATTGQTLTIVLTVSSDWSATILVKEKSSEEGGEEGGDDNGNDNTGGDDTGDDNTGGDDEGGEVTPPTPTPNDITLYYVNSNKWAAVNGYIWPTGGTGILEWPGAPATKIDKTVDGFDVYSYTFDSTKADNIIFNAGSGGAQTKDLAVNAAKPYYYNGVWYETLTFDAAGGNEGGDEGGDEGGNQGGEEGGDTGSEGGEEGGDDTGDVEIGEPANLYIIGALTGWAADATWQFSTADDEYFVLSFPKGQEQELSGQFKVASSNWSPYNYGAPQGLESLEAGKEYVLEYNVATNLSIANIIKVSKIEFTLSTQTLKITGATEEKVFDTTSDYGFYIYADVKDYPFTFKGNGVYEYDYDYTSVVPSYTIGDYQYKTVEWGRNSTGNTVTLGELYQLALSNRPISFPDAATGQTLTIVLTVSSDWSATILVKEKSSEEGGEEGGDDTDPIVPETPAYVVRGNGGSDATGIWCGGIEWTADDSPVNNMTDADDDGIYEVTYKNVPAGTWNFKVVGTTEGWMGSDYLDTENSSAGCTTAPYDGNIGFTLNAPADVTIQFNTLSGKIIATTPSGSFGKVVIEHFHILTGNNQCLDELEFTEANNYTLVLTQEVVIDEEYGVAYVGCGILGNCDYAVYEKYFSIEVTENGTYTVTVQFNGDYETPDFTVTAVKQGGSDEPVVPDPVISDITAPTFPQTEVGKASTATVTYTLENATSATVSIESEGEEAFFIQSQSVVNGKGSVSIMFMPETQGVHAATLVIKSGKVTETLRILAKAVDPAPEVLPVISDIDVPAFADTYLNATNVVTATYSLANATEATATISGANADAFYILSQSVGSVKILFMPEAEGTYNAILTITSGKTSESVNFTAKAIEFIPEPEPAISNVNVPAFATIEIGSAANVTATFTLENATEVSATLSGAGADAFILGQPMVNNGNGSIKIAFVPESAGTYSATLTLKSGKAVHTATITAVATEPAPQVRIENIQVPVFEEVYLGGYASVNVTYTLVNATKATVTVTGDVFTTGNNSVVGGIGTVPVDFMPETAGVHTATLTITAGGVSESVTLVAIAKLKSTDEPSGKVTISNLQVPEFASITAKETTTVTASYVVTGSTAATATISGTDAAYFAILSQTLSEGVGQVEIAFAPTVAREYNATMVVTSGSVTESINFAATASEAPSILGLHVNDFGTVYVGEKVTVMANYSLAYAETATATLSGDTDVFAISRQMVSDGNGLVRIDFTPIAAGTYHATLTIKSGVSEESIDFSATAIKYEEPVIEPVISNLMVPEFGEVLIGETVQKIATYTLENATEATATLSGDKAFTITRTLNGAVRIMFAPTAAGTYNATLTITSGTVSESISFSATAVKDEEPEIEPIISNLMVPEFGEVLIGETVQRIATYTLENATEATATLSGDAVFTITRSQNGLVRIKFAPTAAGTYNGTLTITSGKVSESINFSAKAIEEGSDNPDNPDTPDNPDNPDNPEDPDTPVVPDPLPEYPVRGYMYVVNTPDAELEKMVKYKPVSIDKVDYFLAPEKTGQKIYGYDIYKFEVRDEEMIDLWEYPDAQYTSWHIDVNVDLSATPYLANDVWYASIEEMMTWYVRYIPQWDDEASEKMIVESPNVYVATFDAFAESDDNDKYYYCLGNVEDPILEVGVSEYGVIQNYLQIPQGFKAMIYLDDTNWETEWKTYYKLVPPGKDWNRDCIDLGLTSGLCWATKNLGATEPQDEGTHFAWGEVEPKEDYSYNTYKWANLLKNNEYIKYVTDDYWGTIVDFRTTLEPTDDAANVALEGKWHMPTQADVEELLRECTTEFGSYYGVNGYFVTGPNGNAIFLPAVGIKEGTGYEESTRGGDYWTSSLYEDNQAYAVTLSFSLTYIDVDDMKRTNGLAIRPVIHRDYVGIEEVVAINVYAKDHTIYCEEPFQIYTVTGLEVTHLNGALEGVYIVKTENGNKLISVW